MNKLILVSFGFVGATGVGIGSYFLFKPQKETFKSKYRNSLLMENEDSSVWDARHTLLIGKSPKYKKLKDAVTHYSSTTSSKKLHKKACLEIYELSIENEEYFEDFKTYCTKNMGDAIAPKTFINDAKETTTNWDVKLNELKSLPIEKTSVLDDILKSLRNTITENSVSLDNNHRETLKNWCDRVKISMFISKEDSKFQNFNSYCVK